MTVFLDARTPSATVHPLSGSTPPGAGAVVQPFGIATADVHEMPDPFIPLGATSASVVSGLAARRAAPQPDAEVIDLAGRVKALAERERRLWDRTASIEDAALGALPPRPTRAEGTVRLTSERTIRDDGASVLSIVEPAGWAEKKAATAADYEVARAAWDRRREEEESRRGLPRWAKLRDRATVRLARWGLRLADLEPATNAGVAAKAAALLAVSEKGELLDAWRQKLATSLGRDALRLIGAEADARAERDRQADGDLFHYGRRWQEADREHQAAEKEMEASWHRFLAIAPAVPEEMFVSDQDHRHVRPYTRPYGAGDRLWYGEPDTHQMLREGYPMDLGEERRTEILAAHDRWTAANDEARRQARCDAFEAAETAAAREHEARRALVCAPARTLDGLLLKARAALAPWGGPEYGIEGLQRKLKAAIRDGDATDKAAMAVLLDLARLSAACPATAPVPLDHVEFPHGRYPDGASRDVIENYRTFLDRELAYLNHEIYGRHEGRLHLWLDNPAGRLHGPRDPGPVTRAAAVLGLLGLMPTKTFDGKPLPAKTEAA